MDDFEAFVEDTYGEVLRAVTVAIGDRSRAEEATQEAFARACRRWQSVREMNRPVAWVYVVALNTERKRWRRDRVGAELVQPTFAAETEDGVVDGVVLRDAIAQLAPRQRTAIVLRYLADLTVPEIALVMGCAQGTVKATLHQALALLRIDLDEGVEV